MEKVEVDILVCGGGMSGMACAAFAVESGAKVLVVEKDVGLGGSSKYSAGMFWGPKNYESLRNWVPDGDPNLQRAWMDNYLQAVNWMREAGVPVAKRFSPIMTIGIGYPIDIGCLHRLYQQKIESSGNGSAILTHTVVVQLVQETPGIAGSCITGAILRNLHAAKGQVKLTEVAAKHVVLATGGFQGSPELTSRYLGPGSENIFVRSNPGSRGDGLHLALSAGAGVSHGMSTYYGHLLAAPLSRKPVEPTDFLCLAQYQSRHCLLINLDGLRFVDETLGDEIVNQYLAKQADRRGFILFDEATKLKHCVSAAFPNAGNIDRVRYAETYGCNVACASTLDDLMQKLSSWGVDKLRARTTVNHYYRAVALKESKSSLDTPVGIAGEPPTPLVDGNGPFYAMEVQPSITFTYGGVAIDEHAHALTAKKTPIPGLLIAGVDAGGFSNVGYAGGLALAFVTGFWAARTAARDLGLPVPSLPSIAAQDLDLNMTENL